MKDVILKDLVRLTAYFQSQNMTSNHTDALTTDIHGETRSASTTTSDVYRGTSPVSGPGGINNSFRLSSPHSARPSFPSTPSGPTSGQAPSTQAGPTTGQAPSTQTRPTTGQDPSMQARPTTGQAPSTQAGPTTGQPASTQTRPTTGQAPSTQARPTTGQAVPSTTVDPDVSKSLSQLLQYVNVITGILL
ncbi:hypothetical protein DPMN_067567 [Dreissena polymorpha]|uniref:Uncharacterized protein n=1 Tax=Dreissena polymorpha TaxID=45954 RepID=A0A9D3YVH2_DREPO|nr:hypothetical protein DPMN_067567 [Dreissena polymorpha]